MVPRPTLALRLHNGQAYCYDYKIQTFVPTTFRVIIVCCKDCASNFLLSDTVSFIQAVFTLYVVLVFCCLSLDSILYLISLMDSWFSTPSMLFFWKFLLLLLDCFCPLHMSLNWQIISRVPSGGWGCENIRFETISIEIYCCWFWWELIDKT